MAESAMLAHFITLNRHRDIFSVEEMLRILEGPTHAARLTMLYKITNSLACVKSPDLTLQPGSGRRGHNLKFKQIRHRTDCRSNTLPLHHQCLE